MTTERNMALTRQTFVDKVMSLLLNMLSRLVIAFLPRSKPFNFMAAVTSTVILGPKKIKYVTVFTFPHSVCHEVMGQDAMILVFEC